MGIVIKIINEKGKQQTFSEGDCIVVESPLKGDKNKRGKTGNEERIAHVLKIKSPQQILVQMYTTKDKLNTAVYVEINGVYRTIKKDFNTNIDFSKVRKVKKGSKISLAKINEIIQAANEERINYKIYVESKKQLKLQITDENIEKTETK